MGYGSNEFNVQSPTVATAVRRSRRQRSVEDKIATAATALLGDRRSLGEALKSNPPNHPNYPGCVRLDVALQVAFERQTLKPAFSIDRLWV
jgi:hypothetical protein